MSFRSLISLFLLIGVPMQRYYSIEAARSAICDAAVRLTAAMTAPRRSLSKHMCSSMKTICAGRRA
jgi:hypothetical protein